MTHFLNRRPESLCKFLRTMARAGGNHEQALELAMAERDTATAAAITKAAAASMTGETWGSELGGLGQVRRDFLGPVMERSVLGSFGRVVQPRTRVIGAGAGVSSAWVAEGGAVMASELSYAEDRVEPFKLGAMTLVTRETLAGNAAEVEALLAEDLIAENVRVLDHAFLNPVNAGIAGIQPKSITSDAIQISATGNFASTAGITDLKADIRALFAAYAGSWASAALISNTRVLAGLGMEQILAGVEDKIPVISSGGVPGVGSSPDGDCLVLVDRRSLFYAAPEVSISVASQGALVLSGSGPDAVVPTPQQSTSLFATGTVALKSEIVTGWTQPPTGHVVVLTGIPRT